MCNKKKIFKNQQCQQGKLKPGWLTFHVIIVDIQLNGVLPLKMDALSKLHWMKVMKLCRQGRKEVWTLRAGP